jgi:hypothetical protein
MHSAPTPALQPTASRIPFTRASFPRSHRAGLCHHGTAGRPATAPAGPRRSTPDSTAGGAGAGRRPSLGAASCRAFPRRHQRRIGWRMTHPTEYDAIDGSPAPRRATNVAGVCPPGLHSGLSACGCLSGSTRAFSARTSGSQNAS